MPAITPKQRPSPRKKILIVDDHPMLRRGLAALIGSEADLAVCGEAGTCQAALEAIQKSEPDLVIVDVALDGRDGLDLIKEMKARQPEIPALVLSMHDEAVYAERALRAGAQGYVAKQELDETVLVAIRRVFAGEIYMSEKLKARLAVQFLGGRTLETGTFRGHAQRP